VAAFLFFALRRHLTTLAPIGRDVHDAGIDAGRC
jgi:hypothetical protein